MDWPPSPAHMLNQKSPARGIPYDSNFLKSALAAELDIPDVYFPGTTRTAKGFLVAMIIVSALWACLYRLVE
jgi:hypothetical protein